MTRLEAVSADFDAAVEQSPVFAPLVEGPRSSLAAAAAVLREVAPHTAPIMSLGELAAQWAGTRWSTPGADLPERPSGAGPADV